MVIIMPFKYETLIIDGRQSNWGLYALLMTLLHRAMLAASWILQWQIITHKSVQPQNTPYFIWSTYVVAREIEGMLYSVMKFWLEKLIFGFSAKKIVKKTATYYLSLKNVNDFAHFFLPFLERIRFLSNAYLF